MTSDLTPEEEEGLAAFHVEATRAFCGHQPTDISSGFGPIWSLTCRHGCGHRMSYREFFTWQDANPSEWRMGE